MENETTPVPELYTAVPGDMDGAPVPELINEVPVDGMPVPELYMDDIDMDEMETYMGMDDMPMDDYYGSTTSADSAGLAVFAGMMMFFMIFMFGFLIMTIIALWKIFTKAGEKGWKSIIPFYNTWVLLEIAGKPGWWLFLMFIPFVNIVILVMMYNGLSKAFGKGLGYTLGLIFLAPIFFLMLAFGDAKYTKPVEAGGGDTNTPPQTPSEQPQATPQQNNSQQNSQQQPPQNPPTV